MRIYNAGPCDDGAEPAPKVATPRSNAKPPRRTAPTSVVLRTMRPRAIAAAKIDPAPTATENSARSTVTVSSLPPMIVLISGGNSANTTMPTSQNQLVTIAPHHSRPSERRCWIMAEVDAATLTTIFSRGAPSPVEQKSTEPKSSTRSQSLQSTQQTNWSLHCCARPPTRNGAEKDGDEGGSLHQRVAGW